MPYDIKALQSLYGARNYNNGNTDYQFTRIDQYNVGGISLVTSTNPTKITVWDSGGTDKFDFSALSNIAGGYRLDLNPGGILTAKSAYNATRYTVNRITYNTTTYGTAIADTVLIENLVNSSSSDEIFLNEASNNISGYKLSPNGNDIIWNSNQSDTLDLSLYASSSVTRTQTGQDLLLGLGRNGSVTVKNYYTSPLNILYQNNITNRPASIETTVQGTTSGDSLLAPTSTLSTTPVQSIPDGKSLLSVGNKQINPFNLSEGENWSGVKDVIVSSKQLSGLPPLP
jgi:serralysin